MQAVEVAQKSPSRHQSPTLETSRVTTARLTPSTTKRADWRARYVVNLVVLDFLIGLTAASIALAVRFGPAADGTYKYDYIFVTLAVPFVWVASLTANRAYEFRRLFVGNDEYDRVLRSGLLLVATCAIGAFSVRYELARGYLVIAVLLATALGVAGRYVVRQNLHRQWGRGERLTRVVLVGHEQAVVETTRRLRRERYHGLGVVGACLPTTAAGLAAPYRGDHALPLVYGDFDQVAEAVVMAQADTVIVLSCPEIDGAAVRRLAWQLERDDIDLIVASSLLDVAGDRTTIRPVDGLPLLHIEHPRLKGVRRVVKAVVDRISALLLLIPASLPLAAIALAVRFAPRSRGPVIFTQQRIGRGGQPFAMYKFRTMYVDAESRLAELRHLNETGGTLFKMRSDPRVTPVGRFLRRWSLDELPQLFNVLKGDMSLVGPRPPLASEVAQYPADMRRRLVVKPGLTGLWQVSGRSDLSWEDSVRLDVSYVENWSLTMDLAIMAKTLVAVLRRSGAY